MVQQTNSIDTSITVVCRAPAQVVQLHHQFMLEYSKQYRFVHVNASNTQVVMVLYLKCLPSS